MSKAAYKMVRIFICMTFILTFFVNYSYGLNCIQCHQSKTADCLEGNSLNSTACIDNSSACFTRLDGKSIVRGCIQNLTTEEIKKCKDTNSFDCEVCESESCNANIFPKNRIHCLQCQDCVSDIQPKPCKNYVEFDQCVTVFSSYSVIMRACYSDLNENTTKKCDNKNDFTCKTCLLNGCNNDTIRDDDACVQCSQNAENFSDQCVEPGKPVALKYKKCNITSAGRCYTRIDEKGFLDRGCISNLAHEEQKTCNDTLKPECQVCTGGRECNHKVFPENRLSCKQSRYNENSKFCPLFMNNFEDKCVTIFGDDFEVSLRDCLSSTSETHKKLCSEAKPQCITCNELGCNVHTNREDDICIECNQNTDQNCHNNSKKSVKCLEENNGKCFSRIDDNGMTLKGCFKDTSSCSLNDCTICSGGNNCNNKLYPPNRLSCYQCNSTIDEQCSKEQSDSLKLKLCNLWRPNGNNGCYAKFSKEGASRGCTSDFSSNPCNGLDKINCQDCYTNGCNKYNAAAKSNISSNTMLLLFFITFTYNF